MEVSRPVTVKIGENYQVYVPPLSHWRQQPRVPSVVHPEVVAMWVPPQPPPDHEAATGATTAASAGPAEGESAAAAAAARRADDAVTAGLAEIWASINLVRITRPNVPVVAPHPVSRLLERAYAVALPTTAVIDVVFKDAPTTRVTVQLRDVRLARCGFIDTTHMSDELALELLHHNAYDAARAVAEMHALRSVPDGPLRTPPEGPWSVRSGLEFACEFTRQVGSCCSGTACT
jgi:hypothetical protein